MPEPRGCPRPVTSQTPARHHGRQGPDTGKEPNREGAERWHRACRPCHKATRGPLEDTMLEGLYTLSGLLLTDAPVLSTFLAVLLVSGVGAAVAIYFDHGTAC
ncbi:MAG TPA: hypothetical protein DEF41_01585 [Desulfovibrio sp.]|nr:hypothetical protein [Desulfovibrio sp.]